MSFTRVQILYRICLFIVLKKADLLLYLFEFLLFFLDLVSCKMSA